MKNTYGSIEGDDPGDDEEAQGHNAQAFSPCQTNGNDASSELPCCGIESIRDPVCEEADDAPFPSIRRYRIEVLIRPIVSTKVSVMEL